MKKIIKNLLLVLFTTTLLISCSENSSDPVGKNSEDFELNSPTNGDYELTALNASEEVFTLNWTSPNFGFDAATNFKLVVVKSTDEFVADSPSLILGDYTSKIGMVHEKALTQREFNTVLLNAGGSIGSSDSYKMKLVGIVNNQLASSSEYLISNSQVVTFTATAYDTFDEFERIYVPGGYQGASGYGNDWSPDSPDVAKLFSKANDGIYEGFVWMNVATPEFKFTPGPAWTGDKGDTAENPNSFATLESPGKNIKPIDGAGTYFFTVNWEANTYSIAKRQVAIIGAATPNGWGSPTYLDFVTDSSSPYYQMYTIDLDLIADEFLIRLKDDWSEKMGTTSGNAENVTLGNQYKIKINGGNMKIPTAGNYKVVLDIRNSANYNLRIMPN